MSRRRNNDELKEPVFVLTVPLAYDFWGRVQLDRFFNAGLQIVHGLMTQKLKTLRNLERTKAWRANQEALRIQYSKPSAQRDEKLIKRLNAKRNAMLSNVRLTFAAFEADVKKHRYHFNQINSQTAQKLAEQVWKSFEAYLYGNGKQIHFMSWKDFTAMQGKSNTTGIRYSRGCLIVGKGKRSLNLPLKFNKTFDDGKDRYCYEYEAMQRNIHFCGIKRVWYPDGWKYFAQLWLGGTPPIKADHETGEVLRPIGQGEVGIDIGPQTAAVVGLNDVKLAVLAEAIEPIHKELRRINRAMDRSRRATNPEMFYTDGRVIPINKLPKPLLTSRGKRNWVQSKRYKQLESRRRFLYGQQARLRKRCHNQLCNQLLSFGDSFYIEHMNWQGLAKRRKEDKVNAKGKHLSKKRFGKSIANKAPAVFAKTLTQKVLALGGTFQEINTVKARASQYEHIDHTYKKKKLSQRWAELPNGDRIQRDLYSALLIQNVQPTLDQFDDEKINRRYPGFKVLHDAEIERLSHTKTPSSTGVKRTA